jgi:hypothetical protein
VKLSRDLSGWKVGSGLKRLGFTQTNQPGSHIRLTKGGLNNGAQPQGYLAENAEEHFATGRNQH